MDNARLDTFLAKPGGLLALCAITVVGVVIFKLAGVGNDALFTILIPCYVLIPLSLVLNGIRIRRQRSQR
ncbi:hypothetical protein FRX94_06525 [Corynebacterium canis]|uniref:Uncharacterized protein n=1 Tax=Corynebacterium canis TaxID=679663 RepID=A0A5C5UJS5_9CORY|nr:hypothetical protein [Corynebacterium canis]TWT25615.1 hypothetical protein FRX94_06525 [Corynebacterium canis]WJY74153.1 hypothetical protein CCANI_01455 [Corynebacterium canis]